MELLLSLFQALGGIFGTLLRWGNKFHTESINGERRKGGRGEGRERGSVNTGASLTHRHTEPGGREAASRRRLLLFVDAEFPGRIGFKIDREVSIGLADRPQ